MSNLITTAEHALAAAASDLVKAGKFVEMKVLPELQKAQADAGTIEAVTSLVSPSAANVERAAFAVLGLVIKTIQDAGTAASGGGLNVTLDAQLVSDIKSIAPAVQQQAAASTAAVVAAQPKS